MALSNVRSMPYSLGGTVFGSGKPVMVGSVFYKSDKKVKDHRSGEIDEAALGTELKEVRALEETVGLSHAFDVIAETPAAMERYLTLLSEGTENPLLIGGLDEKTRVAGYRKAKDLNIQGRCGVNSIGTGTSDDELSSLRESGIKFAVLQTLEPSSVYPEEKTKLLKDKLLGMCERGGIEMAAVDVGIIDFTSTWLAGESIRRVKSELGLPAGCAPSNAAYQPLVSGRITRESARSINVALCTIVQMAGADFLLYGPLKASGYLFEAAAVVEGIKAYGERVSGQSKGRPDRSHPLYKFLPKLM